MKTILLLINLSILTSIYGEGLPVAKLDRKSPVNFNKEIYPFFKRNCLACHNHSKAKAKLILETADDIRKGSSSGAVVVPGKPLESLLYTTSAHLVEDVMPPVKNKSKAKNLTPEELAILKLWIEQGAKGSGAVIAEAPKDWIELSSGQPVYALTVSEDGRYAAAGHGHSIDIYDLKLKSHLAKLNDPSLSNKAHKDLVRSLAFSQDGTLASGGFRQIKLWTPNSITAREISKAQMNDENAVAVSADKSWSLYLNDERKELIKKDQKTGTETKLVFKEKIELVKILNSQNEVAVALEKGKVRIFKLKAFGAKDLKGLFTEWQAYKNKPIVLETDQRFPVITGDSAGKIILWDVKSKKPKVTIENGSRLNSIALDSKQNRLIATSVSGNARLWDLAKPKQHIKSLWEDPDLLLSVERLTEEKSILNRTVNRYKSKIKKFNDTIKKELESAEKIEKEYQEKSKELVELKSKKRPELEAKKVEKEADKKKHEEELRELREEISKLTARLPSLQKNKARSMLMHDKAKNTLDLTEKAKAKAESQRKEIDVQAKKLRDSQGLVRKEIILGTALANDKSFFVIVLAKGKVNLYETLSGDFIESINLGQKVQSFSFVEDDSMIFKTESGKYLKCPTQRKWKFEKSIGDGKDGTVLLDRVSALGFADDSTLISASGVPSRSGQIKVWDTKTMKLIAKDDQAHKDLVSSIDFSPDRKKFVSGSEDKIAKVFEVKGLKLIHSLEGHGQAILDTAWSGDGWQIATSSADKNIILWDTETGEKNKTIAGKNKEITIVKFLNNISDTLITSEGEGQIKVGTKGLSGTFSYAYSATVSPDSKYILAGGEKGEILLWDAKKSKLLKSFK